MKESHRVIIAGFISTVALGAMVAATFAQQQTPTQPQPTPDLSRLRKALTETLQQQQQPGQQPGTPGYGRGALGKKGDKAAKEKPGEAGQQPPPPGAPPAPPPPPRPKDAKTKKPGAQPGAPGAKPGQGAVRTGGATGVGGGAAAAAVRSLGTGTYEPVKDHAVEYAEVPDAGEPLTLNGPIAVKEFLDTLSLSTNWNVLVTEEAQKINLQFWINETKPKDALEILKFHNVYYEYKEDTKYLYVMTKQEHLDKKYGDAVEQEFVVKHAAVDYIESMLTPLLSPKGRALIDPRTQHIIVWDTKDNVAKIAQTVEELDVPLIEAVFSIKNANLADMESILTAMLSQSGSIISDPRTGNLLVKDLQDNIDKIQVAVDRFDVALESRAFPVKYVNADTLTESVQALLTERGAMQVDAHSNTLVVTDLPSRQDQIGEVIAALDKKLETRTWTLNYLDAEDVSDRIEDLVPEEMGSIVIDDDVHRITVTAVPEHIEEIDDLITVWDVKRRQVQIEAYLVTATSEVQRDLNINWSYFDSTGNAPMELRVNEGATPDYSKAPSNMFTIGQLPSAKPLLNPLTGQALKDLTGKPLIEKFNGNRVAALLNYLDKHNEATLLSTPRVTVQDGEEAIFQSGQAIPYVSSTSSGYGSGYGGSPYTSSYLSGTTGTATGTATGIANANLYGGYGGYGSYQPYNRIEFMQVGTILNVMPRITEDGSILLEISAEDSSADINNKVISYGQENTIPLKKESKAETQVRVADGQTIVIAGLRTGTTSKTTSRSVPVLSDIPVLGRLFKHPSKDNKNDNLMIFITPTLVDESTQPEAEKLAQADEEIAQKLLAEKKDTFTRAYEKMRRGKNDIVVAIGQGGDIRCNGKKAALDDLAAKFKAVKKTDQARVILRKHPRAPEEIVNQVTEMALDSRIKVELNDISAAFVPNYGDEKKPTEPGVENKAETAVEKPAESKEAAPKAAETPPADTAPKAEAVEPAPAEKKNE